MLARRDAIASSIPNCRTRFVPPSCFSRIQALPQKLLFKKWMVCAELTFEVRISFSAGDEILQLPVRHLLQSACNLIRVLRPYRFDSAQHDQVNFPRSNCASSSENSNGRHRFSSGLKDQAYDPRVQLGFRDYGGQPRIKWNMHPSVHHDSSGHRSLISEPIRIRIASGWFSMGSEAGQTVESPIHRVWLDSFAIAATQVTVQEYGRFLDATGSVPPPNWSDSNFSHPQQPVVAVSWFDAVAYCAWLSAMTGSRYRLPTEAEWERAARGGAEQMLFPWGNDPPVSRPDYHSRWKTGPEPVGQSQPNAYGLFDICENVHEWCSDWYDANYYAISPDRNPQGPVEGQRKASRGGSWRHQIKISRCSARSSIPPDFSYADYGFRVVCDGAR
jgi:formylglycine-generating enzyme